MKAYCQLIHNLTVSFEINGLEFDFSSYIHKHSLNSLFIIKIHFILILQDVCILNTEQGIIV